MLNPGLPNEATQAHAEDALHSPFELRFAYACLSRQMTTAEIVTKMIFDLSNNSDELRKSLFFSGGDFEIAGNRSEPDDVLSSEQATYI
jgi:hypothetical protein